MRLLLSLIFFAGLNGYAQTDLINRTVQRRDSDFLCYGLPNIVEVTGVRNVDWQLRTRSAEVRPSDSPWLFSVEPLRWGRDTLSLSRNGKVVLVKIFEVIDVPNPKAHWGALKKDTATKAEIIANRNMILSIPGCNGNMGYRICSFNIKFITDQIAEAGKLVPIEGSRLTEGAAGLIAKLVHGDKIEFYSIRVVAKDDRIRELPPFTLVIR